MVEILKRSVRRLKPPPCPDCKMTMQWFRSVKVVESPAAVVHFFQCPNCNLKGWYLVDRLSSAFVCGIETPFHAPPWGSSV